VRNRLHPQEIVKETPESSIASGISTPTLDGHATPTGTVYTDSNSYDSDTVVTRDAEDQFSAGISRFGIDERIARSLTEYTDNNQCHGEVEQGSPSQPEPILNYKLLQDMHRYIRFEMLAFFILSTATIALWISWFGQGNLMPLKDHRGNGVAPTDTTSFTITTTKTVHVPTVETRYHTLTSTHISTKTTTSVDIRTRTITTTRISTTTVSATTRKLTGKAKSFDEGTLTRWDRGSSSIVQCYHGNAPPKYYNFFLSRQRIRHQEALRECLGYNSNGIRWKGVECAGARWVVEVDPNSGGIYSDSRKCWRRCGKCLSGAIQKLLGEVECVVDDRGSRCAARYTEL